MKYLLVKERGVRSCFDYFDYDVICYYDDERKARLAADVRNHENKVRRKLGLASGTVLDTYTVLSVEKGEDPAETIESIDQKYAEALANAEKARALSDEEKQRRQYEAQKKALEDLIAKRKLEIDTLHPRPESYRSFDIIVATSLPDNDGREAIGMGGALPWSCPQDLRHFRATTITAKDPGKLNAVIMGRRTWESLKARGVAPLAHRFNVVISSKGVYSDALEIYPGAHLVHTSLDHALCDLYSRQSQFSAIENIFVIGGGQLFEEAMSRPDVRRIIKSVIHVPCPEGADTFFPPVPTSATADGDGAFELVHTGPTVGDNPSFHFEHWQRKTSVSSV